MNPYQNQNMIHNMNPNMMQIINMNQNMSQNINLNQNRFQNMNPNTLQNMNQNYIFPNQVNMNPNYQNYIPPLTNQINQNYIFPNQININQNNKFKQNFNNNIMISNTTNNNISKIKILPQNIQNEENALVKYKTIKHIMNTNIDKCVCKIMTKIKTGIGFFCDIPQKCIKILITNNHIIDKAFLDNENKLNYSITEDDKEIFKEINLKKERYKLTDELLDFTIIEILEEDNINNYLEINNMYNENDQIFSFQYPNGESLNYTHGKIIGKKDNYLIYDVGTRGGSSGSPIILMNNLKVIGLHKGYLNDNPNKTNIGIPIELIINKINNISYIKCTYEIKDNNYIQIINNRGNTGVNKEIESKVKIWNNGKKENLIFKKQFNTKGIYNIYFIIEKKLNNMSFMFNNCTSLKEIKFISLQTDQVTNMYAMFNECNELEYLDLSNFNTSNVTNMAGMFNGCNNLKYLNIRNFSFKNGCNTSLMFNNINSNCEIIKKK